MNRYYCNPINYGYKYQFIEMTDEKTQEKNLISAREGADPSLINFKGRYYLFPSMTCGFLYSDDLVQWNFHRLVNLPTYDYAPDVRVRGEWMYFCASNHDHGTFYRTKDPFSDIYEKIEGAFPFWDPNQFFDDDGRMYFYWGSSTTEPIYGIEMDPDTLQPIGEKKALVHFDKAVRGFERNGENHIKSRSQAEIDAILKQIDAGNMPESMKAAAKSYISEEPYLEGAWMSKHGDTYYLQCGETSSAHNIYSDVVYVSKHPLGPFTLAENAPMSYKTGGFLPGAGHGSTMDDNAGNTWHIATQRICINQNFERRIGLWQAGWDADGEMFCNQRYGDWPICVTGEKQDPWENPKWMLLSYGARAEASSCVPGKEAEQAVNEDIRTWWRAASNQPGEWLQIDLGHIYDVHAIQVNMADDHLMPGLPEGVSLSETLEQDRWIDEKPQKTQWKLEGSLDGADWFIIEDKRQADTDLPHDLVVRENGFDCRFVKLSIYGLPYGQEACVSGLRVFGLDTSEDASSPAAASDVRAVRTGDLDMDVTWQDPAGNDPKKAATGYVVEWGHSPEKLYHSMQVFGRKAHIAALVKDQPVYVRVDAWNGAGITEGNQVVEA